MRVPPDVKESLQRVQQIQLQHPDSAWYLLRAVGENISANPAKDSIACKEVAGAMVIFARIADSLYFTDIAIEGFRAGLRLYEFFPQENRKEILGTTLGLGISLNNNYRLNEALEVLNRALQLSQVLYGEYSVPVGNCYDRIGAVYSGKRDYYKAVQYFQKQYNVLWKVHGGSSKWLSYPICQMADAYNRLGDYSKAIQLCREGQALGGKMGGYDHYYWGILSDCYMQTGDYDHALEIQLKTIGLKKASYETEFNPEIGESYRELGDIFFAKKDFKSADSLYRKSLYLLQNLEVAPKEALACTWLSFALLHESENKIDLALSDCAHSLGHCVNTTGMPAAGNPSFYQTPYPQLLADILACKGDLLSVVAGNSKRNTDLEEVLDAYEKSIECNSHIYREMEEENSKTYFVTQIYPLYEKAIGTALKLHEQSGNRKWLEKAFLFVEKSKAASLLEAVRQSGAEYFAGVPEELQRRERSLLLRKLRLEADIQFNLEYGENENSELIKSLRDSVFATENARKALTTSIAGKYPEYYSLKYDTAVGSISALQKQLSDRQMILEYFQGADRLFAFAVTASDCDYREIRTDTAWTGQIRLLKNFMFDESPDSPAKKAAYIASAHALYEKLMAPFESLASGKQGIIVIPDGELSALPLQALLTERVSPETGYRKLPYVIRKWDISYSYSATLLMQPFVKHHPSSAFGGWAPDYEGLSHLFFNREEVQKSAGILGGDTYLGEQATESVFKKNCANYDILLLSMHGFVNDTMPGLSRLVFSEKPESGEDGSLHTYEVYGLSLAASLTVLSACETGKGFLLQGEGIQSIARAFRYAGCPSVIASYWKANEAASAELIGSFFNRIRNTTSVEALEAAKRYFIDHPYDERLAHPHFWATFNCIDGYLQPKSTLHWYGWALAAVLAAWLVWIAWRRYVKKV
ncbi:MAG TPA: CHAT domain-containing protein [Saprospiraceae bacterium]|nr:CHAT domain-containing protein [Saprospiraceae bacterium]HPI06231.1 CHAT domain-containing protein [Saprospiraceae bacterium]